MKQNLFLDAALPLEKNYLIESKKEKNVIIKHYYVKEEKNYKIKHDKGDYFTISFDDIIMYQEINSLEKIVKKILKMFLKKYHKGGTILILGLGNSSVLGDSFGVKSLSKIIATNHYNDIYTIPKVALFSPETTNKTGISSFKLISMVVNDLKPDVIILLDSLVTENMNYINRTLEINDCGIVYADALKDNKCINKKTFGIPVLTIGYPTLWNCKKAYFTKLNLEEDLVIMSDLISRAINQIIMS